MTAGGDDRGFPRLLRRCERRATSTQFALWYAQAGTPEVDGAGRLRRRSRAPIALDLAQTTPPTPGQPASSRWSSRSRSACVGPDGRRCALTLPDGRSVDRTASSCSTGRRDSIIFTRRRRSGRCRRCCAASRRRSGCQIDLDRGRPALPVPARHRSVQPLAGGADACHCACSCGDVEAIRAGKRAAPTSDGLVDALGARSIDARPGPRLRRPGAGAAQRGRHRPRNRPRRRSRRDPRGAHGRCAAAIGPAARGRAAGASTAASHARRATARTPRAPAAAPCATPRSTSPLRPMRPTAMRSRRAQFEAPTT